LQAVEKLRSRIELEHDSTTSISVVFEIGSAFRVSRSGWQRLIPLSILFNYRDSKGASESCLSTWTARRAESIEAMVLGLTFFCSCISGLLIALLVIYSARACSVAGHACSPT
jgi:hypothetical protein